MKQNQKQPTIKSIEMFNSDLRKEVNFQLSDNDKQLNKSLVQDSLQTDVDESELTKVKKKKNNVMTKAQARRYIANMEKNELQEELREPYIQKSKFYVHSKLTNDYRVGVVKRAVSTFEEQKLKRACATGYFSIKETIDFKNRLLAKGLNSGMPARSRQNSHHMATLDGSHSQSIRSKKVDFFKEFVSKADNMVKIDLKKQRR